MKICTKCKLEKEYDNYHKCPISKDGYAWRCKPCRSKADKIHRDNLSYRRKKEPNLKYYYGITYEEYEQLLIKFKHTCGICPSKENLCVDHCHTTKKVRGILCGKCNKGLGLFKDNKEYLQKAIEYLWRE